MVETIFPTVTFLLATLMIGTFVFIYSNIPYYENLLGFVPANVDSYSFDSINSYSAITYTFVHVDYFHLLINLIFLFIAGLSLEERIGKIRFLLIYIFSALFAVLFDLMSRYAIGISPTVPFVGASGAIFGLLAVASLLDPHEKVPAGVVFVTFLPYVTFIAPYLGVFANPIFLIFVSIGLIAVTTFTLPLHIPMVVSMLILIINWFASFAIKYPLDISSVGHLGGVIGGIVSFFLLSESLKYNK